MNTGVTIPYKWSFILKSKPVIFVKTASFHDIPIF